MEIMQTFSIFEYNPTFVTSNGFEKMLDDMSATNGTPFVSGTNGNSTPRIDEKPYGFKQQVFMSYL